MPFGKWLREEVADSRGLGWPRWVPIAVMGAAVAVAVGALAQRDALLPPTGKALVALVAISPWLVEHLTARHPPGPVFAALVIAGTSWLLLDPVDSDLAPFLFVLLALEIGGTGSLAVAVGTVIAVSGALMVVAAPDQFGDWWLWTPGVVAGSVGGLAAQGQVRLLQQERTTRTALAQRLAAEDRQRVAREVHDVIAHSLSVTMLHLTAARHALETDADVEEAVESLREAERVGRQATGDLRRTVGLLDGGSGAARPLPGVDDLPRLIDEFRTAGIDVRYELRGEPVGLSPAAGLDLYRVTEESLTNVAKHAPGGRADVTIDASGDPIRLRVVSTMPQAASVVRSVPQEDGVGGRGIMGMRQRVELLGGTFHAGPEARGWCLVATLPRSTPQP